MRGNKPREPRSCAKPQHHTEPALCTVAANHLSADPALSAHDGQFPAFSAYIAFPAHSSVCEPCISALHPDEWNVFDGPFHHHVHQWHLLHGLPVFVGTIFDVDKGSERCHGGDQSKPDRDGTKQTATGGTGDCGQGHTANEPPGTDSEWI